MDVSFINNNTNIYILVLLSGIYEKGSTYSGDKKMTKTNQVNNENKTDSHQDLMTKAYEKWDKDIGDGNPESMDM